MMSRKILFVLTLVVSGISLAVSFQTNRNLDKAMALMSGKSSEQMDRDAGLLRVREEFVEAWTKDANHAKVTLLGHWQSEDDLVRVKVAVIKVIVGETTETLLNGQSVGKKYATADKCIALKPAMQTSGAATLDAVLEIELAAGP
jgi:hypothetical protein